MPGIALAPRAASPDDGRTARGLARLAAEIGAACDDGASVMPGRVIAALQTAAADPGLLSPDQCAPCPDRYARHVVHADPGGRFTILALVWGPGQFSPVHAHDTWCAYAVRGGRLTETLFQFDIATQRAVPLRRETRHAGYGCFGHSGLEQIHRLGNAGPETAISIHVYGVDGARICSHVNRVLDARPEGEGL